MLNNRDRVVSLRRRLRSILARETSTVVANAYKNVEGMLEEIVPTPAGDLRQLMADHLRLRLDYETLRADIAHRLIGSDEEAPAPLRDLDEEWWARLKLQTEIGNNREYPDEDTE